LAVQEAGLIACFDHTPLGWPVHPVYEKRGVRSRRPSEWDLDDMLNLAMKLAENRAHRR